MTFEFTAIPPYIKVGGTFSLDSPDTLVVEQLLRSLSNYRVLYDPYESEYAGAVIQAIQRLRETLGDVSGKFSNTESGSAFASGVLSLQGICADFLTTAKQISSIIEHDYNLTKRNMEAGLPLKDDQIRRMEHYESLGGADLFSNGKLNVMQIEPPGYQHQS